MRICYEDIYTVGRKMKTCIITSHCQVNHMLFSGAQCAAVKGSASATPFDLSLNTSNCAVKCVEVCG